jgi:hypothetical protein
VQLTTLLAESFKSGKVTISENNVPQIEIKAENKHIDINAENKKLIKDIVSGAREGTRKQSVTESIRRSVNTLSEARKMKPLLKEVVEDLCREGVTVIVSYKGDRVVTIGSEANSKLARLVTGTRGIEINSPGKLAELGI